MMYQSIQLPNTVSSVRTFINRSSWRHGFHLIVLALACSALSPMARAVDPPPDGGYTGQNTAEGEDALLSLTTGTSNSAIGFHALHSNKTGSFNTAIGWEALANTNGDSNTANGAQALISNTTGNLNTANGAAALLNNTTGNLNTANGGNALLSNTTGNNNAAFGRIALVNNTTGNGNIALGEGAGRNLTTGNHNIHIGHAGLVGESNHIRIGTKGTHAATFVAGIYGSTAGGGVGVFVAPNGHLGTIVSSARFKEQIKPMDKASEAILALQPVTFRYKQDLDPESIPQFGLVAEEVEKVNAALVARDEEGKPYTVRYEAVNAMLLNEFLKEHRKGLEQEATITQLKSAVAQQQKEIKALRAGLKEQASQIQKVSEQLEVSKAAPPLVANNK